MVVGVSNTAVSMAVYLALLAVGTGYLLAMAVAYTAGVVNGYTLNRRWTFSAGHSSVSSFNRYTAIQGTGLLASICLSALFVESLDLPEEVAPAMIWPVVTAATFTATRMWAFGTSRS